MPARRVQLVLPELPSDAVLELARALKVALSPRYTVQLKLAGEIDGEFADVDRTPVDFRPNEAPLIIQISEDVPTLS